MVNACDPGMQGEELGDMAGIEGALYVAFHSKPHICSSFGDRTIL